MNQSENKSFQNIIPVEIIDQAWREVSQVADVKDAKSLSQTFTQNQQALAHFFAEMTEGSSDEAVELGYYLLLVLWKCFSFASAGALLEIDADCLIKKYEETVQWLEKMKESDPILLEKKIQDLNQYTQPHVMQFVIEGIFESHEDGFELTSVEQGRLFIILKVVTDCFQDAGVDKSKLH